MLISFQAVKDAEVDATDGNVGSLEDLLMDRSSWKVRYLLIRAARWLITRKVLLAPGMIEGADWPHRVELSLTRDRVRHGPDIDDEAPLPRQKEYELARHFGWKPDWQPGPVGTPDGLGLESPTVPVREGVNAELWNAQEMIGYTVHSREGPIGFVEDVLFDDADWFVRYFVVDVDNWITGRRVLTAAEWIDSIGWDDRRIEMALTRYEIEQSPEFDPTQPVNRDYENRLYDYYGRSKHWESAE